MTKRGRREISVRCPCIEHYIFLFVSKCDTPFVKTIRCQLYLHLISRENLDVVHSHLSCNMTQDHMSIIKLYSECCIWQRLYHFTVNFDYIIFCHVIFLLFLRLFGSCCFCQYNRFAVNNSHLMFIVCSSHTILTDHRPLIFKKLRGTALLTYHRFQTKDHTVLDL